MALSDESLLRVKLFRAFVLFWFRALSRFEVYGVENFPRSGPTIMAMNHLHWLDPPIGLCLTTRKAFVFTADKWENVLGIGHFLRWTQQVIFVARGQADRRALGQALGVLRAGGLLGIAPEGTRSKTGTLQRAHSGVAYLASRTGATIVPVAATGQEKAFATLRRLRRPRVVVIVGQPFKLSGSPNRAKGEQLDAYTDEIMHRLAALLPPEYRGSYALDSEAFHSQKT
jgi:1-acyl-sn-glycerol-3-phosphate acyltransferase